MGVIEQSKTRVHVRPAHDEGRELSVKHEIKVHEEQAQQIDIAELNREEVVY